MRIVQGKSAASDATRAVAEATSGMVEGGAPSLLLVFASTRQDPIEVASALAGRFPDVPMAGCTTAGEIVDGELSTGALVVSAIWSPEVRWAVAPLLSMTNVDAAALGLRTDEVTADVTFMNPLTFAGELYVRSIQKIEDDGSIVFYCGIEEGMVLAIGGHEPMAEALVRDLSPARGEIEEEKAELFVAFNCILRALEIRKRGLHAPIGDALRKKAKHVIGFDTYGEQLDGLHINQTLVGIALGGSR